LVTAGRGERLHYQYGAKPALLVKHPFTGMGFCKSYSAITCRTSVWIVSLFGLLK
jgi:hypothetical protein